MLTKLASATRMTPPRPPRRAFGAVSSVAIVLALLLAPHCRADSGTVSSDPTPTPAQWEQWQPETDHADSRLDRVVTITEQDIELRDLLARLSQASAVPLQAAPDLLPTRLTLLAERRTLGGIMLALSRLYVTHWTYPPGAPPADRTYLLVPSPSLNTAIDSWLENLFVALTGTSIEDCRRDIRRSLSLYREALSLTPDDLLARYEQSEPWFCDDLLDPDSRPFVEFISTLPPQQIEDLLSQGLVEIPFRLLHPQLQQRLATQAAGSWSSPALPASSPAADQSPPPVTLESLRENGLVELQWCWSMILTRVTSPSGVSDALAAISVLPDSPAAARQRIADLGYREATPEYLAAMQEEERVWDQTLPGAGDGALLRLERAFEALLPPPNRTDPRLAAEINLDRRDPTDLPLHDLLAQAARRCQVAVIASYLPLDQFAISLQLDDPAPPTLGFLLDRARRLREGQLSWNFYGDYLVVTAGESWLIPLSGPDGFIAWVKRRQPIVGLLLDEVGNAIAAAVLMGAIVQSSGM